MLFCILISYLGDRLVKNIKDGMNGIVFVIALNAQCCPDVFFIITVYIFKSQCWSSGQALVFIYNVFEVALSSFFLLHWNSIDISFCRIHYPHRS